ncbi:MAG: site-specific recombinase, partial [Bdellovibrionales bacterium]
GLFLSGLLAGFADNWFVFNHVGPRLKNSDVLKRFVSAHNLDRVIHSIDHNLGFWVGNVSLGFYLGSMGALGTIFGLPLDTRHITFSSGQFGAAMATLKFQVPTSTVVTTALAIFCFGLINLGVSFSLSLFVAVRSRNVQFSQTPELLRLLGKRFLHHPFEFIFPPRTAE